MPALRLLAILAVLAVAFGGGDAFAAAQNDDAFAVELYAKLRTQPGNLFVSPAGVADAFRLVAPGAAGTTERQIRQVFHFGDTEAPPRFPAGADGGGAELHSANALWLADDLDVRAPYLEALADAAVQRADFAHDPAGATAGVNAWAAEATKGRIRNLLRPGVIKADTRAVVANAVYFKAAWAVPFAPEATRNEAFFTTGSARPSVSMMHGTAARPYFRGRGFQAVELPFQGEAFGMVLLVPDKRDGLAALEAAATPAAVAEWLRRLEGSPREVDLTLPRFQMTHEVEMKAALSALGLELPFSGRADFSRISPEALKIDAVVHQAFVKVDETGAEAAAATAIVLVATASIRPPARATVRADRPFLFLIRDSRSGAILFMGRLADPR